MTLTPGSRSFGFLALKTSIVRFIGSLVDPLDPDWVTACFEHSAGRGDDRGEPRAAGNQRGRARIPVLC